MLARVHTPYSPVREREREGEGEREKEGGEGEILYQFLSLYFLSIKLPQR